MPSSFPCSPVIRECSWKKTQIEKKKVTPFTPEVKRTDNKNSALKFHTIYVLNCFSKVYGKRAVLQKEWAIYFLLLFLRIDNPTIRSLDFV